MENIKKLRCPICNAKINGGKCPYCKITDDQIVYASNTKAKKEVNKKKVYNSTFRPIDVRKSDMLTITILYGLLGIGSFFVGKRNRGIYQLFSFCLFFVFFILEMIFMFYNIQNQVFDLFFDLILLNFGICIIMWTLDIFRVCFNRYAYPVVLPDVDKIDIAKEELKVIKEKLDHKNDKYKNVIVKIKNIIDNFKTKLKTNKEKKLAKKQEKLTIKQQKLDLKKSKLEVEINKNNDTLNKDDIVEDKGITLDNTKNIELQENDLGLEKNESNGIITEKREIKKSKKNRK